MIYFGKKEEKEKKRKSGV